MQVLILSKHVRQKSNFGGNNVLTHFRNGWWTAGYVCRKLIASSIRNRKPSLNPNGLTRKKCKNCCNIRSMISERIDLIFAILKSKSNEYDNETWHMAWQPKCITQFVRILLKGRRWILHEQNFLSKKVFPCYVFQINQI